MPAGELWAARGLRSLIVAPLFVAFIVATSLACRSEDRHESHELRELGTVPPFELVDDRGQAFTEQALRGHPTIVDFVFTRCDTICPTISARMAELQDKLSDPPAASILLVSISVDPNHDTPEKLAAYAAKLGARPDKWRFVTGRLDRIERLVKGPFGSAMAATGVTASGAPAISHSGNFVLVDGDLTIRGIYDSGDPAKLEELMRHARYLARTRSGSAAN